MSELKLSPENQMLDVPDLNRFRIGDHVAADACQDCDYHEGIVVGIEFQRFYGSSTLVPSITLLHDGYLTDGFKPMHLRKVDTRATAPTANSELAKAVKYWQEARLEMCEVGLKHPEYIVRLNKLSEAENALAKITSI